MIPWRGPKTSLQGCQHKPRLRKESFQDGLWSTSQGGGASKTFTAGKGRLKMARASPGNKPDQARQRHMQKSHVRQGSFADGKGLTRQQARPGQAKAHAKIPCQARQGSFADGKALTGNKPNPGKGDFRRGSFEDGKGLTGNKPSPGRGTSKNPHFRQGAFADGEGLTGNKPSPGRGACKKSNFRQVSFGDGLEMARA